LLFNLFGSFEFVSDFVLRIWSLVGSHASFGALGERYLAHLTYSS